MKNFNVGDIVFLTSHSNCKVKIVGKTTTSYLILDPKSGNVLNENYERDYKHYNLPKGLAGKRYWTTGGNDLKLPCQQCRI